MRTPAIVIAEAWRDPTGRQAHLARLLPSIEIRAVDGQLARGAGELIGRAGTDDPIDATVVLVADDGDRILRTDPSDIRRLVIAAGRRVVVVARP